MKKYLGYVLVFLVGGVVVSGFILAVAKAYLFGDGGYG